MLNKTRKTNIMQKKALSYSLGVNIIFREKSREEGEVCYFWCKKVWARHIWRISDKNLFFF